MIRYRNRIGIGLRIRIRIKNKKSVKAEWKNYKVINGSGLYRIKIKNIMTIRSETVEKSSCKRLKMLYKGIKIYLSIRIVGS